MFRIYSFLYRSVVLSAILVCLTTICVMPLAADTDAWNPGTDFAQVTKVRLVYRDAGTWDVYVTVRHNDQGWDHFADRWQVLDAATGEIIGERILAHPHDNEQPFTRSLSDLRISEGIRTLIFRSSCPSHGFGGKEISVDLPTGDLEKGDSIVVE